MVSKQKILIVDDDNNIAELISLYLTKECFDTMIVNDGESVMPAMETFAPNLILLDLMLPGIDGYQVCREVRAQYSVPIIMLSAKGEVFDKVLGLELGADDYMEKPFDSKELVARTTEALNNGISTMTIVQNTLKDSSDDFDAAARESLRGSMELLDKSLSIFDSTTAMRQAGRTMKDTIDNELDKFDTDNRFLFMDPSAEKVSFTSDKNRPPKTLQIVLRTDEISVDDDDAKTVDAEVAKAKESPLRRMWNVLVQMWKAMVSIFKNR